MALIKIPPVLRSSVGGEKEVEADGGDVGEVLRSLADQHPDTASQLFGSDGSLKRSVNVSHPAGSGGDPAGRHPWVGERHTLYILPAWAGGAA
jgi:molybdopterin synthase sulfur carrier subunit